MTGVIERHHNVTGASASVVDHPIENLRVLGLPGSGKTRTLIDRYRTLLQRKGPGSILILTYSRQQLGQIVEMILEDRAGQAGQLPVYTHFTLAREVFRGLGRRPPGIVEALEENLLVGRVVREHTESMRSDFEAIHQSERFQRELLALFHFLLQHNVRGERLNELDAAASMRERVRDVLLLYRHFVSGLDESGRVTYYDMAWSAVNACGAGLPEDHLLKKARVVLVDDFQDLDAGQFALLGALYPPGGGTVLNVFGDPMGSYFGFRGTSARYLLREFPRMYGGATVRLPAGASRTSGLGHALSVLSTEVLGTEGSSYESSTGASEKNPRAEESWGPLFETGTRTKIRAKQATKKEKARTSPQVTLHVVRDEVEEAYTAAWRVHELVSRGQYRPDDVAIVTNDKGRYEPLVWAAFCQRGVPLTSGRTVSGAFRNFVFALFTLIESPRHGVATQTFMTSPYYRRFRTNCLGIGGRDTSDRRRETVKLVDYLSTIQEELRRETPGARMLRIFQRCLLPVCRTSDGGEGPVDVPTNHLDIDDDPGGHESIYAFLSQLKRRWDEYTTCALGLGEAPRLSSFVKVGGLFDTRPSVPMPSSEEVGFYSCREIKGRFFPVVIVLGCSELLFPSAMRREGILPLSDLQQNLNEAFPEAGIRLYGARTPEDHLSEEYHLLYHSLTRATEELRLLAPVRFGGHIYPAPAAILRDTLFDNLVSSPREGEDPSRRHDAPREEAATPPQVRFARLWTRSADKPDPDARIERLSPMGHLWAQPPLSRSELKLDPFPISKSSLESFLTCERRFFYTKVVRVPEEETGPLLVGGLFHEVMRVIGEAFPNKTLLHEGIDDDFIYRAIDEETSKIKTIRPDTLFGRSLRFHLHSMVKMALDLDRRESEDYTLESIELPFSFEYQDWTFSGRADRVDRTTHGALLIDYKTGTMGRSAGGLREKTLATLEQSDEGNWQIPLYVWWYLSGHGELPDAFRHLVQNPGEEPYFLTTLIRKREEDVPADARRSRAKRSFLLEREIVTMMQQAVLHAGAMFSPRRHFEKTDAVKHCRQCYFNGVCERRVM